MRTIFFKIAMKTKRINGPIKRKDAKNPVAIFSVLQIEIHVSKGG